LSTSVRGRSWWKLLTWLLGTSQISRWLVRVTGADARRVEGVAPLPRRAAHGLVSHDHTIPAVTVDLADPLDDPAPPPPATDTHPHSDVARGGAALFPGDARTNAAGVRDRIGPVRTSTAAPERFRSRPVVYARGVPVLLRDQGKPTCSCQAVGVFGG
jgi:hypothetical protein